MGKSLLVFMLVLVFCCPSFAQTETDLCYTYLNASDYSRAVEVGKRATARFPGSFDAHFCLGQAYLSSGDLNSALRETRTAERLATNNEHLQYVFNRLGIIYNRMGDLDSALLAYDRALSLSRQRGDREGEAGGLNNLAGIFHSRGNHDKALSYYKDSLNLRKDEGKKATTYNNMAAAYAEKGDYQTAVKYLKMAADIHERRGDHHLLGKGLLNLADIYRQMGDTKNAWPTLRQGLKMVREVGDKYWEATGYEYLSALAYRDGDPRGARQAAQKAFDIFSSTGATKDAEKMRAWFAMLDKDKRRTLYAGIEIGAKGVKAMVLEMSESNTNGFFDVAEEMRKSVNTGIISGVARDSRFNDAAMEDTAQAVKGLLNEIVKTYGFRERQVAIVGSSALAKISNRSELEKKVEELTGVRMSFVDKDQEALYSIAGSIPLGQQASALLIDIGSGSTQLGYIEGKGDERKSTALEVPYGTVSLSEASRKVVQKKKNSLGPVEQLVQSEIIPKLKREFERKPSFTNRSPVYMTGGLVWALATLMHPDQQQSFVRLSAEDIIAFHARLMNNASKTMLPDLSKISDANLRQKAAGQIQAVRDTFTVENLIAGSSMLKAIANELRLKGKTVYFSRNGSWLWGFLSSRGAAEENRVASKE